MNIHTDNDGKPVSSSNPLPVTMGFNSSNGFNQTFTTNNATTAVQVKSGTSDKSIYITDLVISSQAANTIQLVDSDGTTVLPSMYFPATSIFSKSFSTPIKVTSAKALMVTSSIAANISIFVAGILS